MTGIDGDRAPDPRRWWALVAMVAAVVVVTLDTTILNVAVPTISEDLHTDLASMQWVLSGYTLTLGALLIVGGRLGDLVGARATFVAGALIFAVGSFIASAASSVWMLVLGEAVIEGVGAALLMPASLATVSVLFTDDERAKAFAVWGGAAGAAAALGPVLGGWLATDLSWRWGFRINVVVAPLAAVTAMLLLPSLRREGRRPRFDLVGASMAAAGLFLLVFAITEGTTYGWWSTRRAMTVAGGTLWPDSAPLSPVPVAFAVAVVALVGFVTVERRQQRGGDALLDLTQFRLPSFRFGLTTAASVVMAQSGALFVLAIFLQTTHHLSAAWAGLWLLPVGAGVAIGAQAGGWLARRVGAPIVVRAGIGIELAGVVAAAAILQADTTALELAAGTAAFGVGAGLANSQLTNVILSDVPPPRAGSASGAATTNNALGAALGVAILGTVLRASPTMNVGAARAALVTAAAILAAGAITALAIPRRRPDTTPDALGSAGWAREQSTASTPASAAPPNRNTDPDGTGAHARRLAGEQAR